MHVKTDTEGVHTGESIATRDSTSEPLIEETIPSGTGETGWSD